MQLLYKNNDYRSVVFCYRISQPSAKFNTKYVLCNMYSCVVYYIGVNVIKGMFMLIETTPPVILLICT